MRAGERGAVCWRNPLILPMALSKGWRTENVLSEAQALKDLPHAAVDVLLMEESRVCGRW